MAINNTISAEEAAIRLIYQNLIQAWNNADAKSFAGLFAKDGSMIGFDGSQANGREEIESHLSSVFKDHKTAKFITLIREVRLLNPEAAVLRGVAGMVRPGHTDISPELNAIQSLVIQKDGNKYRIALFHNTPAAFHGRPGDVEKLSKELRKELELTSNPG